MGEEGLAEVMGEGGWAEVMGEGGLAGVMGEGDLAEVMGEGGLAGVMGEGGLAEVMGEGGLAEVMGEGGCIRMGPDIKKAQLSHPCQSSAPVRGHCRATHGCSMPYQCIFCTPKHFRIHPINHQDQVTGAMFGLPWWRRWRRRAWWRRWTQVWAGVVPPVQLDVTIGARVGRYPADSAIVQLAVNTRYNLVSLAICVVVAGLATGRIC